MTFLESVRTGFIKKPFNWRDRASKSEFGWISLAVIIGYIILIPVSSIMILIGIPAEAISLIVVFGLVWIWVVAAIRRLHDTNRRGWWLLIPLLIKGITDGAVASMATSNPYSRSIDELHYFLTDPSRGILLALILSLIYWGYLLIQPGNVSDNRFGSVPE